MLVLTFPLAQVCLVRWKPNSNSIVYNMLHEVLVWFFYAGVSCQLEARSKEHGTRRREVFGVLS